MLFNLYVISFIIILIFNNCLSDEKKALLDIQCALKHTLCNPNLPRPCCDLNDQCNQTWPDSFYRCISDDIPLDGLGKFCELDNDCDEINHSKCSKDRKCICRMKNVRVDAWTCAPVVGGFCWNNEPCATDNAVCIDSECKCTSGYSSTFNNQCVRDILGTHCDDDETCNQVKFAKCSEDKVCTCTSNTTAVNPTYCGSIFGGFCWITDDCITPNSRCIDNRCQCEHEYKYYPERGCAIAPCENDDCSDNSEHATIMSNSICTDVNVCMCFKLDHRADTYKCTPIDVIHCTTDDICAIENSKCINSYCQCKPKYVYRLNRCMSFYLNESCTNDDDCSQINHAVCSFNDNVCVCNENYIQSNETLCKPLLDGFCSTNTDCVAVNSSCIDNKCQCKSNMVKQSKDLCVIRQLGIPCENNHDCQKILNSICSKKNNDKKCECKKNYGEYNITTCAPLIGEYCLENDKLCAPLHSSCKDDKCVCDAGFIEYSNNKCLPHYIRMLCENDSDCRYILNSECRRDVNVCSCKSTHDMINHTTCAPLLGNYCEPNEQCATTNSHCIHNKCQCKSGYYQNNKLCLPIYIPQRFLPLSCAHDNHCDDIKYALCSSDKQCICKPNYIFLTNTKCIGFIGEYCDAEDECAFHNTICVDNKCQCSAMFYAASKTQCNIISLGLTCRNNHYCSAAIKNSECSTDNICVCRKNYYALNKFECVPALSGYCSKNDDCRFNSSVCIENKCQCQHDFRAISINQCRPNDYFYSCNNVLDCGDPWHYVCDLDKKCRCSSNHFSMNRSTCIPFLNGYCWKDSQCSIENSTCIDYHCQCRDNFVAVSNNLCRPVTNSTGFIF